MKTKRGYTFGDTLGAVVDFYTDEADTLARNSDIFAAKEGRRRQERSTRAAKELRELMLCKRYAHEMARQIGRCKIWCFDPKHPAEMTRVAFVKALREVRS